MDLRLKLLKELGKYQVNIQIGITLRTQMMIPLAPLTRKVRTNGNNVPKRKL